MKSLAVVCLLLPAAAAADDQLQVRAGGLLQLDGRWFPQGGLDQFATRSLRPEVDATYGELEARLVPDFAGGKLVLQDAYVDVAYLEGVTLRVGKMKVPFGLERLQPEGTPMFVERGLPTQIAPNRDVGVELYGEVARAVAWQVAVMNGVPDGAIGDTEVTDQKDGVARVFVKPVACIEAGLGGAVTYGYEHGNVATPQLAQYKTQGLNTFAQFPTGSTLDTTAVAQGRRWRATAQGYWFQGPFGALAEYQRSSQEVELGLTRADVTAEAWQAEAQWVITGERATYKNVTPRHPFGAFDVVARFDELRLDQAAFAAKILDPAKSAQRARGFALGADWFANAHLRATIDVERTVFRGGARSGDRPDETVVTTRLQAAF